MGFAPALRGLTIAFGCVGIAWGAVAYPKFERAAGIEEVSGRIIQGHPFGQDALLALRPTLDAVEHEAQCQAPALRASAIIRYRIAESAMTSPPPGGIDETLSQLDTSLHKALACSPTDSFLWFGLFWLESTRSGFKASDMDLLRMSYREGPSEGWIIMRRNWLSLAMFSFLPPDLAELTLNEFPRLLRPEFVLFAADNFIGPGWPIHDKLLERIADTPIAQRERFTAILRSRGVVVKVPGVDVPDRPYY